MLASGHGVGPPLLAKPLVAVAMRAALMEAVALNNQRLVLTRDRSGAAALWDVTIGALTEKRPQTESFVEDLALLFLPDVVSSWFTVKIVSGAVCNTTPNTPYGLSIRCARS